MSRVLSYFITGVITHVLCEPVGRRPWNSVSSLPGPPPRPTHTPVSFADFSLCPFAVTSGCHKYERTRSPRSRHTKSSNARAVLGTWVWRSPEPFPVAQTAPWCFRFPQKYYPPDFDPSKIPKLKLPKDRQYVVRLMAPFNMR